MAVRAGMILVLAALVLRLFFRPTPLRSCGPFFEHAVFTFSESLSPDDAARGRWDVIQPGSPILNGRRADRRRARFRSAAPPACSVRRKLETLGHPESPNGYVPAQRCPAPPRSATCRQFGQYQYLHNCLEDAFANASRTLDDRVRQFGPASTTVAEWLRGQDTVFRNCGGGSVGSVCRIGVRADRNYQTAAARFYAMDFERAKSLFRAIASDSVSPWREIAPYLAVRAMIRRATLANGQPDIALLPRTESELRRLADDPRHRSHDSVRALLAPNHLAGQAIRWALANPQDPRVPEALHLAVRATRYGCVAAATSRFSRQAFDLLHRRYPKNVWARKTRYWF